MPGRGGDKATMRFGLRSLWPTLLTFKNFDDVFPPQPFSGLQDVSTIWLDSRQSLSRRNDLQMGVLSHRGHPFRRLLTWRWPMPHYYFDIKDGHRLVDPAGLNFKTDDDAIARA
jgi:hypothetical protein